jgi:predicted secreted protein with PEFG-CTERM motif
MQVVPEFSIAVIMILVISITGIIVASSKLRITPRLS